MPEDVPAFWVIDAETIPDGVLLNKVKYPKEALTPEQAIGRAHEEARAQSNKGSDFLPVTFHLPIALGLLSVGKNYELLSLVSLDAPLFRTQNIVQDFWHRFREIQKLRNEPITLITFNGKGFDLPVLDLMAFRFGIASMDANTRNQMSRWHLDLMDWITHRGTYRPTGGLKLLSKVLGNPGKLQMQGDQVYSMYLNQKIQEINDYCLFDVLDTYLIFLRTRVMTGEISLEDEQSCWEKAKVFLREKQSEMPALKTYLENWNDYTSQK